MAMDRLLYLTAIALSLGELFVFLFYLENIGLNFPLYIGTAILGGVAISILYGKAITKTNAALLALAFFFAGMVFVRESEQLTFFNIIGSLLLLLTVVYSYAGKSLGNYTPIDYAKIFILPIYFLEPYVKTLIAILRSFSKGVTGEKAVNQEILRGSLMALV